MIAKGAKLRVISRKRGWVEVSNPATSQQGWIYLASLIAEVNGLTASEHAIRLLWVTSGHLEREAGMSASPSRADMCRAAIDVC